MKILLISPYIPLPVSGGKMRVYNILKNLVEMGHNVHLICLYSNLEKDYKIEFNKKSPIQTITYIEVPKISFFRKIYYIVVKRTPSFYFAFSSIRHKIWSIIQTFQPDVIHAEEFIAGIAVPPEVTCPKFISEHNFESEIYSEIGNYYSGSIYPWSIKKNIGNILTKYNFKKIELDTLSYFDHIFSVSIDDKDKLVNAGVPADKITIAPNGVDLAYFMSTKEQDPGPTILFMGNLDYFPNQDATLTFYRCCFLRLKRELDNPKFYIVGPNPPKIIKSLEKDSQITVTGFVKDVREFISKSSVCIAPIRYGSGTRLKILEYMAMERPVVSTTKGAEGLNTTNGKNIILADTDEEFVRGIVKIHKDKDFAKKIAESGRRFVEENYDWKVIVRDMVNVYESMRR